MSTRTIQVAIHGAAGRVGREMVGAIAAEPDMAMAAAIDRLPAHQAPALPRGVPYFESVERALQSVHPDVVVDFTNAAAALGLAPLALAAGIRPVIGSTGFSDGDIAYLRKLSREHQIGAIYAPNFTVGAALLERFAAMAAPFFDYVEVLEEHHEQKVDAPSGTALAIVHAIQRTHPKRFQRNEPEREPLPGTRGADAGGISVHSSRMPGRMAHHQVTFGGKGQTLTLRHDTIDRQCYVPGVLLAVRRVMELDDLSVGLQELMEL